MVRVLSASVFALLLALPALAQDDFPRFQTSLGYGSLSFPTLVPSGSGVGWGAAQRHSGFVNQTGINLTKTLGLDNYMGIYGLGQGVTMITDVFGGKATWRGARVAPYGVAGIGVGYLSAQGYQLGSSFATRIGAGFDVPFRDSLGWRFELSRFGFHIPTSAGSGWTNSTNFSAGIVISLPQ